MYTILLAPFLSMGIKIPKHNIWSIELADYPITFIHIEGKSNVLSDTIFRLKTLDIDKEPVENPKAPVLSNIQGSVAEIHATSQHM